jgi:hypothetical protein
MHHAQKYIKYSLFIRVWVGSMLSKELALAIRLSNTEQGS